jgi:signal transduction histidine kinase/ligand-binding sensor domain-containing protein
VISWWKPIRGILIVLALVFTFRGAHALDPSRLPSQYVRELWTTGSRFPGGAVNAIVQTPDGYLWIGTDKGLLRFDGFNFSSVSFTSIAPNVPILQLLVDAAGELWIRPQGADLVRRKEGKFEIVRYGAEGMTSQITVVSKDSKGGVLVSDIAEGTFRFNGNQVQKVAAPTDLPGSSPVISMAETAEGKIWMGTLGAGLFFLGGSRATNVNAGLPDRKINCLLPVSNEELWLGSDTGLYRWNGNEFHRAKLPSPDAFQVLSIIKDRDSNIWVGTASGLLRFNSEDVSFSAENDLRGNGGINALFEDREGNLWIGGAQGLGRIRNSTFATYSSVDDRRFEHNGPVYVDRQRRAWLAPAQGGLLGLQNGRVQPVISAVPTNDVVYSIVGTPDELWLGRQRGGLTHLQFQNGAMKSQTYTKANGLAQNSVYAVYASRDGSVWAGTLSGGVSQFKDGRFTTYTTANGLAANAVSSIVETHDGRMWFGTSNGLSSLSNRQWTSYSTPHGLPSPVLNCLFEDSIGTLWSGTSAGIAFFASDHFHVPLDSPEVLHEQIFGITEDKKGWLWIATSNHVVRVSRDKLVRGEVQAADVHEYGTADGLPSNEGVNRSRSVITDPDGKVWFSLNRGLSVVDPSQLVESSVPAIVHIETVSTDGAPISSTGAIRISASHKRIAFAYTALSLAIPERIRFRYRVDDFDKSWSEAVAAREAVYTNLSPGSYRFRVVASNSQGEWNGSESAIRFEVAPVFWQTWWFRSGLIVLAGFTALLLHRLHLHRLTQQLNMRFEERLAERTRIAQELHDTLLQGVLSASMQLHVASDRLENNSAARPLVNRVLQLMGQVVDDGRNAIRGLRLTTEHPQDLDQALSRVPHELMAQSPADFRVLVEGPRRALHPLIRDEVFRIGREAIANALRHSRANTILVELEYGAHEFRLQVQDDGCGIDQEVLRSGRDGHWGLSGMRERSEKIGAKLKLWSKIGDGTEVDLRIPARVAFTSNRSGHVAKWFSNLRARATGAHTDDHSTKFGKH